ncbi:MAG: hypothetical protein Q9160_005382 [Pyrenula sp. 1 TL-2023]
MYVICKTCVGTSDVLQEVQRRDFDMREIGRAVIRMPKLEKIQISTGQGLFPFSSSYHRDFDPGNTLSQGDMLLKEYEPPGFRQMMGVMTGLCSEEKYDTARLKARGFPIPASIEYVFRISKLKVLHLGFFGWMMFLCASPDVQKAMGRQLVAVEDLKMQLTCSADNQSEKGAEIDMCEPHLRESGCLRALVTSAPVLRKLHIEFDIQFPTFGRDGIPTELRYVVGNFIWEHLEDVTFVCFEFTSKRLIDFLNRHKQTLKRLRLRNMCAGREDTWQTIADEMKAIKKWEYASLEGQLSINGSAWTCEIEDDSPDTPNLPYWEIRDYLEGRSGEKPALFRL